MDKESDSSAFLCPHCIAPLPIPDDGAKLLCHHCQTTVYVTGYLCVYCHNYEENERNFCGECERPLKQICHHCQTPNWAGNTQCQNCDTPLDTIERHRFQSTEGSTELAQQQMSRAHHIKSIEQQSSEKRMAGMLKKEEARQMEEERQKLLQQVKDKQRVQLFVTIFVLAILLFSIIFLLT